MAVLRLILGDQLSPSISSLQGCDKARDIILLCEVASEVEYVGHHPKKIILVFSAMRHFAAELSAKGYNVCYVKLTDRGNTHNLHTEVLRAKKKYKLAQVVVTHPGEYRVYEQLSTVCEILPDTRFMCSIAEFKEWAGDKNKLRMEFFYRWMRKRYDCLMKNGKPLGGKWNYDNSNRKHLKNKVVKVLPLKFMPDEITVEVIALVGKKFVNNFGDVQEFNFAVTRKQAKQVLGKFIKERLVDFGEFQDAMLVGNPWLYHSHLSFYLNCGLLEPKECIKAATDALAKGHVPLNSVEGFIRQIMGWREFVRGIYWRAMPKYKQSNFLGAQRKLPSFFWTIDTDMNCLRSCLDDTKRYAYANHIQRLMVLGNFLMLVGVHPDDVNAWYLAVFADAYEWVELPNVMGMILFADGGVLASKPYVASGAYINKMSNYCKHCKYKVTAKTGEDACPFNYLYWSFLLRNKNKLSSNPRLALVYKQLDKMAADKLVAIKDSARKFLARL